MAEKKSGRKRKKGEGDVLNPTKDETAVAKHLRFNLQTKKASMFGDQVVYFTGASAVDLLLDSKWAKSAKYPIEFTHRDSVAPFLQKILDCGLFNRVHLIKTEKIVKDKKKDSAEKKKDEKAEQKFSDSPRATKPKDEKSAKEEKTPGSPKSKRDKDGKEVKRVKKKVKITLELHEFQDFFDSEDEFYVWIFDPISWKTFVLGILLVLGVIAVCLFPLWPENIREYSWYLSVAGAVFVGSILVLAILRYIIYGVLWIGTMGKLSFWLLPNLTAECGFFESFVPTYEYTVCKKEGELDEQRRDSGTPAEEGDSKEHDEKSPIKKDEDSDNGSNGWVKVKKGDADEKEKKEE